MVLFLNTWPGRKTVVGKLEQLGASVPVIQLLFRQQKAMRNFPRHCSL